MDAAVELERLEETPHHCPACPPPSTRFCRRSGGLSAIRWREVWGKVLWKGLEEREECCNFAAGKKHSVTMSEFIYNINEIFDKALKDRQIQCYYIPPYQRGYKWDSSSIYDQVPQMLLDVFYAYEQKTEEYYLQYITVKKKNGKFEVIDGQQRLTTLSLFFYCYNNISQSNSNIVLNKVSYDRYSSMNVFEWVMDNFQNTDLSKEKSQDKYYLLKAAQCIYKFFEILQTEGKLPDYITYLSNQVKIILNEESEFVDSESTFANLNDNKVPLTNAYLIKGLLLTLSTKYVSSASRRQTYKEILDQRAIMGRMWDEIQSWIQQPRVTHYFFGHTDYGMERLLTLVDLPSRSSTNASISNIVLNFSNKLVSANSSNQNLHDELELFNRFNEVVKDEKTANDVLSQIKHIYYRFRDVYDNIDDSSLYNKIGYLLFAKPLKRYSVKRLDVLQNLIQKNRNDFNNFLKSKLLPLIPVIDRSHIGDFRYDSSNSKLTNLLLAFSVFPEGARPTYRFDFYQYDEESWSFEHIYPQNPPKKVTIAHEAKPIVLTALKTYWKDKLEKELNKSKKSFAGMLIPLIRSSFFDEYIDVKNKVRNDKAIDVDKLEFLYAKKLKDEHSCGNMALMSGGANSALSNNPYIAKRIILNKKEMEGYFIPIHTKTIFHKALSSSQKQQFNQDLTIWDDNDVAAHIDWMIKRNTEIRNSL